MLEKMEKKSNVLVKRNQAVDSDGSGLREEPGWAEQMPPEEDDAGRWKAATGE